jgi:hypothetical protein
VAPGGVRGLAARHVLDCRRRCWGNGMFGIGRGQPKVSMRHWAEVGAAVLRMDRTILAALVVASISMGFTVLLGWRLPQLPGY